ncbi:MAG: hypothetical protein ACLFTL_02205, partial [Alphaproteobacteria bacterium]
MSKASRRPASASTNGAGVVAKQPLSPWRIMSGIPPAGSAATGTPSLWGLVDHEGVRVRTIQGHRADVEVVAEEVARAKACVDEAGAVGRDTAAAADRVAIGRVFWRGAAAPRHDHADPARTGRIEPVEPQVETLDLDLASAEPGAERASRVPLAPRARGAAPDDPLERRAGDIVKMGHEATRHRPRPAGDSDDDLRLEPVEVDDVAADPVGERAALARRAPSVAGELSRPHRAVHLHDPSAVDDAHRNGAGLGRRAHLPPGGTPRRGS